MSTPSLLRRFVLGLMPALAALLPLPALAQAAPSIVISQVYGGGGNSGSVYKNDFIELSNPTSSTLTLTNYSIQYASATSSGVYQVANLPSPITLAPGQYFLIQDSQGAGGTTNLPTPDSSNSLALSATAGKVALVSSTTALDGTNGCPTANPSVVDFVGFGGTGVNCSLGSPAPALTNTASAVRTDVCVNTGNNAADFTRNSGTIVPHNSASPLTPCSGTAPVSLAATGTATPATLYTGAPTLLTVQVTPATQPTSSGLTVTADLSSVGGSSSQPFYDDGTHGDLTPGDNIFSFTLTPSTPGTFALPVQVLDSQLRSVTTSIALTAQTPPPFVTIRTIQANKPSTYVSQTLSTSGIVVGVKSTGFYLEAKDADTHPTTPEGILVYTGSTQLPSYIALGNEVEVTGIVHTYPTTSLTPDTEIDGPQTFQLLSSGNPLPAPVPLTTAGDSPSGGIYQFTPYEGMRVSIGSFTTTSGTGGNLTETTETNTSTGRFYGVVTGIPRPFREPGISITDTAFGPVPPSIPRFDSNPELLYIDSLALGGTPLDLTSDTVLTGLTGVVDFSFGTPEVLLDASDHPGVSGGLTPTPVPAPAASEFTVASFNMERFYNDIVDADNPGSTAVTVTTAAYGRRLNKASIAIRNFLLFPDILGAQEIENIDVLTDLANKINSDAVANGQPNPAYVPYLFLANDGTAINTGFLVKSTRIDTLSVTQVGLNTTFTTATGTQAILNDRTPLVLHAGVKRSGGPDYPVTVIDVHQRSLINVDDPTSTGATVRLKREAQAEFLANLIQSYQAAGEHVVTVGDFNAFQFSDGFVDTIGVTIGTPVPASEVITPPVAGLVNPPLIDLVTLLPPDLQQSYVESGSAQVLDHVLITQDLLPTFTRLVYDHLDADFPLVDLNDPNSPDRVSDHDPAVAYFTLPAADGAVNLITTATLAEIPGGGYTQSVTVTNIGAGLAPNVTFTTDTVGSASTSTPLPALLGDIAAGSSSTLTLTFPASAGAPGTRTVQRLSGTYTGGSFGGSLRSTLP